MRSDRVWLLAATVRSAPRRLLAGYSALGLLIIALTFGLRLEMAMAQGSLQEPAPKPQSTAVSEPAARLQSGPALSRAQDQSPPLDLWPRLELAAHERLMEIMEAENHRPASFATDGCSGGLSLVWTAIAELIPGFAEVHQANPPWESCCVTHDRAYHAATGAATAADSYQARLKADEALQACVIDTGARRVAPLAEWYGATEAQVTQAYALVALALFDAVRLGGGPCSGLPWRWGYGYPNCF